MKSRDLAYYGAIIDDRKKGGFRQKSDRNFLFDENKVFFAVAFFLSILREKEDLIAISHRNMFDQRR
jgi:hypothetical protein